MAQSTQEQLTTKIKENYQSIILGALVILVGLSTLAKVSSKQQPGEAAADKKEIKEVKEVTKSPNETTKYTVKKGDTIWKIAELKYDSGYAWTEIAKANNLKNANMVEAGQTLTLPKMEVKSPTTTGQVAEVKPETKTAMQTGKVTLTGSTYKVVAGDHLWSIAVRAYGDGYAWTRIAKENKLVHPNIIHPGNVLKLPR